MNARSLSSAALVLLAGCGGECAPTSATETVAARSEDSAATPLQLSMPHRGQISDADLFDDANGSFTDHFTIELEEGERYTIDARPQGWEAYAADPDSPPEDWPESPVWLSLFVMSDDEHDIPLLDDRILPGVYTRAGFEAANEGRYHVQLHAFVGHAQPQAAQTRYRLAIYPGPLPLSGENAFTPPPLPE